MLKATDGKKKKYFLHPVKRQIFGDSGNGDLGNDIDASPMTGKGRLLDIDNGYRLHVIC